jgi:hypothetical protein
VSPAGTELAHIHPHGQLSTQAPTSYDPAPDGPGNHCAYADVVIMKIHAHLPGVNFVTGALKVIELVVLVHTKAAGIKCCSCDSLTGPMITNMMLHHEYMVNTLGTAAGILVSDCV